MECLAHKEAGVSFRRWKKLNGAKWCSEGLVQLWTYREQAVAKNLAHNHLKWAIFNRKIPVGQVSSACCSSKLQQPHSNTWSCHGHNSEVNSNAKPSKAQEWSPKEAAVYSKRKVYGWQLSHAYSPSSCLLLSDINNLAFPVEIWSYYLWDVSQYSFSIDSRQ